MFVFGRGDSRSSILDKENCVCKGFIVGRNRSYLKNRKCAMKLEVGE